MTSTTKNANSDPAPPAAAETVVEREPVRRARPITRVAADTLGHPRDLDRESAARHGRELLDHLLADLASLDIPTPAPVTEVFDLWARTTSYLDGRRTFAQWLGDQDLADLSPETIAAAMRETRTAGDRDMIAEVGADMLDRALDALADAADDVTRQLRPAFDPHARTVADAVAAGVTAQLRAEVAIGDDTLVTNWRAMIAAVPTLSRLHATYYRLLLVAGFNMAPGERALVSGTEWMAAAADGPPELVLPTERVVPPLDTGMFAPVDRRSGTAEDVHAEREVGYAAARQAEAERLDDLHGRVLEWVGEQPSGIVSVPVPDGDIPTVQPAGWSVA